MIHLLKTLGGGDDADDRTLKDKMVEPAKLLQVNVRWLARIADLDIIIRATAPDKLPAFWDRIITGARRLCEGVQKPLAHDEVSETGMELLLDRAERKSRRQVEVTVKIECSP